MTIKVFCTDLSNIYVTKSIVMRNTNATFGNDLRARMAITGNKVV